MSDGETLVATGLMVNATHYWPDAPQSRHYLGHEHMHTFRIDVLARVETHDREIEFHDLRDKLDNVVDGMLNLESPRSFGPRSCEQIADEIMQQMPEVWEARVFEDEQCGSIMRKASRRDEIPINLTPPRHLTAHNIITICGSTRFKAETLKVARKLVAEGWIVEMVEFFAHADEIEMTEEAKRRVDQIHKDKIRSSHAIYVVNPGGYIGESTRSEIDLAMSLGLQIQCLEPLEVKA